MLRGNWKKRSKIGERKAFFWKERRESKGEPSQSNLRWTSSRNEHKICVRVCVCVLYVSLHGFWSFGSSKTYQIDLLQWTSVVFDCPAPIPPSFGNSILIFLWKTTLCPPCIIFVWYSFKVSCFPLAKG